MDAFGFQREIDHHDGVFLHDAHQQDDPHQSHQRQIDAADHQRQQRADSGRRQRGQNSDRVDPALVQHAQHDVDHHQSRQDQPRFGRERSLKLRRVAGEGAADGLRHADVLLGLGDGRHRVAERVAVREIEAERRGGKLLLMRDDQRRGGFAELGDGGQRNLRVVRAGHAQQVQ